jgi:ABC-type phosphate/phosphonate transport system substrate-binding protein
MKRPIVNARMYTVNARAGAAWRTLLAWILARAGLDWEIVEHPAPLPMAALWSRDDLGAALMCGLPFSLSDPQPRLIAAPVPAPPRYRDRPVYMTDLVVRADAPYRTIEDTFGARIGYTVRDSQSGCVAVRHFLARYRTPERRALYREAVGDLLNARGVIDALVAGRIDAGPLDSYSHDLLRHLEPVCAAQVRVVAITDATPIPPFVASAPLREDELTRLRDAFLSAGTEPALRDARDALLLARFAVANAGDYRMLKARHDALTTAGEVW